MVMLRRLSLLIVMTILLIFPRPVQATETEFQIIDIEVISNQIITPPPKDECFIATAAYGSKNQSDVVLLRKFRDEVLLSNSIGKEFVKFYYKHSPPIANYIADNVILRFIVRILLIPLVMIAFMVLNPVWLVLGLGVIGMLFRIKRKQFKLF